MGENRNFAALDWVTQEIDETLSHARDALEDWANDPNDKSKIRFCLGHIHQVHGSLQMVEFYGAALLAEELEHLAQALCDEKAQYVVDAQEALMRGIVQLPKYLDYIKTHRDDQPAMILPLLNDLRAVRGESLLSESRLFNPDLKPATQFNNKRIDASINPSQFLSVLKKLQQMYQFAAAAIIRGVKVSENIVYLNKVLARQYKLTSGTASQPLWEISLALVEALEEGGLELTASVKLLLRQLNRQFKILLHYGVAGLDRKCDEELLKNLLFYVAISTQHGRFVSKIREKYKLGGFLNSDSDTPVNLQSAPDTAAIRSVVAALKEELRTIKFNLDDCLTSDSVLEVVKESFPIAQRVADTLAILGVGDIRKQMLAQVSVMESILETGQYNEQQLFNLASEMIDIESRLDALTRGVKLARNDIDQQKAQQLTLAQDVVLAESRNGLEQTKDCIIEYIASQWDQKHLEGVPKLLREIRGGLEMVPLSRAAQVLGGCAEFIEKELLAGNQSPEWRVLDTLADAIASIEYYLEHLSSKDGQNDDEMLLAVAEDSVRNLGIDLSLTEAPTEQKAEPVSDELSEAVSSDGDTGEIEAPVDEEETPSVAPFEDPWRKMLSGEYTSPGEAEEDATSEESSEEDTAVELVTSKEAEVSETVEKIAEPAAATAARDEDDLIDDEIIEIFIEEAEEVKETIAEYFPRWSQDFNDSEALTEFRRGFHTLKGSGRMVGASDIGELAWAIENMLNRVLDKTIKPDAMQVELINRVLALLPSLIESFSKNRPNPQPELCRQYMSWADEIASGSEPEALLNPAEEKSQKKTVTPGLALDPSLRQESVDLGVEFDQSHPESESVLAIDDENLIETSEPEVDDDDETLLWEIFSAEAQGHLDVIQEYIDAMDDAAPVFEAPSDPMQRALHTLKGSAHMAEVGPIAQLVGPFESFVKELRSYQLAIDEDILTLVKDGVAYIHLVLDQISHNEALDIPKLDQFLARVSELRDKTIGPIVRQQDASQQAKPVDPELLSIFMAEEMNLLLDADVYLEKWRQDQISQAEVHAILNELHLLVQGAKRANYPDMAQLSSLLERLYHVALGGSLNRTSRFYEVLNRGHDFLLDMIDSVAAGQNLPPLSMQLRAEMELLLDEAKANALRADQSLIQSSDTDDKALEDEILEEDEVLAELETFDSSDLTLVDESELDDSEEQPASAVGYESSEEPIASFDVELVDETDEGVEADLNQVSSESPSAPEFRVGALDDASWFTVGFTPKTTSESNQAEDTSAQDSEWVESADNLESEDDLYLTADVSGEQVQDIHDFTDAESESEFVVILEENQDIVDQAHNEEIPTLLSSDDDIELIDAEPNFVDDTTEVHEEFALEDDEALIDDIPILEIEDESTGEILDSPLIDESLVSEQYVENNDLEFIDEDFEDEILSGVDTEAFIDAEAEKPEYENIDLDAGESLEVIDDNALIDDDMDSFGRDEDSSTEIDETSELAVDDVDNTEDVNQTFDDTPEVTSIRSLESASSSVSAQPLETAEHLSDLELDNDIVEIFAEESSELLEEIDVSVHDWMEDWTREDCSEKLKRLLHTFKGSARLAGLMGLGEAAHEFESYLIKEGRGELDDGFFNKVNAYYELLYTSSDKVQNYLQQQPVAGLRKLFIAGELDLSDLNTNAGLASSPAVADEPADAAEPELASVHESYNSSVEDEPLEGELTLSAEPIHVSQAQTIAPDSISNVVPFAPRKTLQETPQQPLTPIRSNERLTAPPVQTLMGAQIAQRGAAQESVKVAAELLEELVNLAGETSISRARMEEQVNEIGYTLDEMDFTIDRLQEQLRRLDIETEAQILFRQEQMEAHEDFDPLEMDRYSQLQQLSRSLMESASDLIDLKDTLSNKTRDTETLLLQQSRINTELQEGLMRSRMVPFSRLVPRLRRIVRQISTELGKRVNFELDNIEGELDRTMLERMVAPLEHMLRNAVDHGIEMPEVRVSNGKNEVGTIRLGLGREGGDVILRLSDDGRGINIARVRDKAIERGLMTKDAELSDKDIMQFILHAGFSTAEKVTQISGRGVGMDVVNAEIKQLGGSVSINSQEGRGSEFIMRLPFTLSVNRALMVVIGEDYYAVPLNTIEGIVRVSPYELEHYYNTPDARFEYAGQQYQVKHLGNLLDENHRYQVEGHALPLPVLLVRSQEYSVALQVDGLMGSREIVVKSLGPQFNGVDGLSGATVMGDGSVVVILDLLAFVRRLVAQSYMIEANAEHKSGTNLPEKEDIVRTVIIVDDSVTVRKVTSRFLEREGFDVMTAKDGVDAIRQLQDRVPDVMLLDIEMPRMDGFEVAKNVRSTSHLKDLPIIMITSRTGSKHRERAYELGVNHYLGKPYQEDDLLYHINLLTGQAQIQD